MKFLRMSSKAASEQKARKGINGPQRTLREFAKERGLNCISLQHAVSKHDGPSATTPIDASLQNKPVAKIGARYNLCDLDRWYAQLPLGTVKAAK